MVNDLTYRVANEKDLLQILELLSLVKGDKQDIFLEQFIVAHEGERIVGCVRIKKLEDGTNELASLGVVPKYRRQSIGRNLVQKVVEYHKERPVYLLCFKDSEHFYTTCGFSAILHHELPDILKKEYERVSAVFADSRQEIISMIMK